MGDRSTIEQATPVTGVDPVAGALAGFEPIRPPRLRVLARNFWWMQLALLAIDAVVFPLASNGDFPPATGYDWLRIGLAVSPHLFVALGMGLALSVLYRAGRTIGRLWDRNVLYPRADTTVDPAISPPDRTRVAPHLTRFINELGAALNPSGAWRNPQWWLSLSFVASFVILFFAFFPAGGWPWGFPFRVGHHVALWLRVILILDGAVQVGLTAVLALVAHRLVTLAVEIIRLARTFDVHLLLQHPDKSGGLGPLGDLCFSIAAIWGVAAVYPTAWLATLFLAPIARPLLLLHLTVYFAVLLGLTFTLALATFFVPIYFVHRAMDRARRRMQPHLDALARQVDVLSGQVISATEVLDERRAEELGTKLAAVQQTYAASASLPSWPFDGKVFVKYIGTTVIPLSGITAWLPALVKKMVTGS